ncbi:MAG: MBL fold metallo-hydrolase [Candidatus Methanofastidiosia archaeon]|jgi:glyoxylase-like metal-dependent hydrolase (beta-lactamase superfamily II)
MTLCTVSEYVYVFFDGGNTTALLLPERVVVIDAGISLLEMAKFRNDIEALSGKKVDMVILTHFHSDHTRGTPVFGDCTIVSSNKVLKRLKEAKRKPADGYALSFPDKTFDDQLVIKEGGTQIRIKETGGHTDDSSYVYCSEYKVLAAGDNVVVNGYPFGGKGCDPEKWIQALKEYITCDVEYYIPGHGPVTGKDTVKKILGYMIHVREIMTELIAQGTGKEEVLKRVGEVKYVYTPRDVARKDYFQRWKRQYLTNWYNFWKRKEL